MSLDESSALNCDCAESSIAVAPERATLGSRFRTSEKGEAPDRVRLKVRMIPLMKLLSE